MSHIHIFYSVDDIFENYEIILTFLHQDNLSLCQVLNDRLLVLGVEKNCMDISDVCRPLVIKEIKNIYNNLVIFMRVCLFSYTIIYRQSLCFYSPPVMPPSSLVLSLFNISATLYLHSHSLLVCHFIIYYLLSCTLSPPSFPPSPSFPPLSFPFSALPHSLSVSLSLFLQFHTLLSFPSHLHPQLLPCLCESSLSLNKTNNVQQSVLT